MDKPSRVSFAKRPGPALTLSDLKPKKREPLQSELAQVLKLGTSVPIHYLAAYSEDHDPTHHHKPSLCTTTGCPYQIMCGLSVCMVCASKNPHKYFTPF